MSASPPVRLQLRASSRVKRSRDFALIRQQGRRIALGCLIGNWRAGQGGRSRLGVVTSGRLGSAVVRNRARRLLRESFRLHQHELAGPVELILVARPSIVGKGLAEVERDFLGMASRAGLLKEAGNE